MQTKLTCPGCFASIPPEDINIDRLIAKCRACGTVFDFDNREKQDGRQKPEVLLPPGTEVKQLYVEKYISSRTNGSPNDAYRVNLILDNQRTVRLIHGLRHPDQARYIEQQVERFLEIEDRPVREEWQGV